MPEMDRPLEDQGYRLGQLVTDETGRVELGKVTCVLRNYIEFLVKGSGTVLRIDGRLTSFGVGANDQYTVVLPFSVQVFILWVRQGYFDLKPRRKKEATMPRTGLSLAERGVRVMMQVTDKTRRATLAQITQMPDQVVLAITPTNRHLEIPEEDIELVEIGGEVKFVAVRYSIQDFTKRLNEGAYDPQPKD